ncbi:IS256 family transposase [Paenibacillus mucilaginosus]|uniref:Mutator family transposase n=1 Tax=Paenibacillus mucilaginosus (strain KNP414) TaxID=1036673 RepID=F8FHN8_PAEMK|nr:IS256 family transposase [Paenibacillus mucilaginosus]AEI39800.1 mutator family transposase [Paenibacillus mucilaginosus KNP414]AEI40521.1 mutator family transposase [Paenibacillus mucilaginosus KNP414]AEI41929.1 mutator family transposase [Paenibacillus mucilaginosus KNP414]AEI42745.1 mutator family transposase [Paenibacillus mucilaginosus KNP414]AEI44457.1 mutator family transposase [Paenibacillus mucilaginosus KNP414]
MTQSKFWTKQDLRAFVKEHNFTSPEQIQTTLKELFKDVLQEALEAELDTQLGYDRHDVKNKQTKNSRNGYTKKTVTSEYGDVEIQVPRDRLGEFTPVVVKKHQTNVTGIEDQIIALYAKGVSTRDIQDHLEHLYGIEVSPTLISNVTNKIVPLIKEWQNRPLQSVYTVVFLDAIHFKVKQDGHIVNKAAYMVIGIDLDGNKDVLGIWIGENETAKFWLSVLNELRNRGVQDILITCVDNLTGFSQAIAACFPQTEIQKCIIHQIRNSIRYVSYKDVKKVTADLKPIYKAPTEEAAQLEMDRFEETWGEKYPLIVKSWRQNWDELTTFFRYPAELRRLIYTTNMIESYHRQLRKVTKGKSIFPTDESLMKMLYLSTMDVLKKWTGRVQNWGQILLQLTVYYPERVEVR